MGTILYTPEGIGLYEHEGYVSHVLTDGTSARGTWTTTIEAETVAWRAECTCGWDGAQHDSGGPDSPSDRQYDQILKDWEVAHAGPLLRARERAFHLEALAEAVAKVYEPTERGDLPCLRLGRRKVIPRQAFDGIIERAVEGFDASTVSALFRR